MSQTRYVNFGDTVLAARINQITTAIVEPGVLAGGAFDVFDAETLSIAPITVMLETLLLKEDEQSTIAIPLTAAPEDYTIVYEHVNQNVQGGAPASLLLVNGIFSFGDLVNSVILGWIRYPGGSVPLSRNFFIEAPKLRVSNPTTFPSDVLVPPFLSRIHLQAESPTPGSITAVDVYDSIELKAYLELENTAASIQSITYLYPFVVRGLSPDRVLVEIKADLGAAVTVLLVAEDGTTFTPENNVISNTSNLFVFREMEVPGIDRSLFSSNRPYFVSLTAQLNPGRKAFIALVGTNTNFLPF